MLLQTNMRTNQYYTSLYIINIYYSPNLPNMHIRLLSSSLTSFACRNLPKNIPFPFSNRKNLQEKINQQRKQAVESAAQKPSDPELGLKTPAEKWGIRIPLQVTGLMAPSIILLSFINNPFCDPYFYLLFGLQKIAFGLTMLNIRYPQNSKYLNYTTIAAAVIANLVVPITNIESIGLQFFQILILLSEETKKMDENLNISEEEKILLKLRIHIKLFLFLAASAIIVFKLNFQYHRFKMEKKINELNMLNQLQKDPQSHENTETNTDAK